MGIESTDMNAKLDVKSAAGFNSLVDLRSGAHSFKLLHSATTERLSITDGLHDLIHVSHKAQVLPWICLWPCMIGLFGTDDHKRRPTDW